MKDKSTRLFCHPELVEGSSPLLSKTTAKDSSMRYRLLGMTVS